MSTPRAPVDTPLDIQGLDQIMVDYVYVAPDVAEKFESKNFESKNYSLTAVGATLFEKRLPIITLLNHVVRGEYDPANAMLEKNPKLLLESDTVTDYSGRIHYNRTAYQLAQGAVDRDATNNAGIKIFHGMVEMLEKHFYRLPSVSTDEIKHIMQKQYTGQFPENFEEEETKRAASDLAALNDVWTAVEKASELDCKKADEIDNQIQSLIWDNKGNIKNQELHSIHRSLLNASTKEVFETNYETLKTYLSQTDGTSPMDVLKAVYQFRNHMEPKAPITSGFHYNRHLLEEAGTLYDSTFMNFGGFNGILSSIKNKFCWEKLIGYINRFLPACDAQIMADGTNNWHHIEKDRRCLEFLCQPSIYYYPLQGFGSLRLGYDCAVFPDRGLCTNGNRHEIYSIWRTMSRSFQHYMARKYHIAAQEHWKNTSNCPVATR